MLTNVYEIGFFSMGFGPNACGVTSFFAFSAFSLGQRRDKSTPPLSIVASTFLKDQLVATLNQVPGDIQLSLTLASVVPVLLIITSRDIHQYPVSLIDGVSFNSLLIYEYDSTTLHFWSLLHCLRL